MSLDVYLTEPGARHRRTGSGIFVRDSGATREITREEWDARNPGREPVTVQHDDEESCEVYSANVTHNLGRMAREAGIYEHLWRPDEVGVTIARELIEPLRDGLALLNTDPGRFCAFNPDNGWGDYAWFCRFVSNYLAACESHPDAEVSVWR